MVGDIEGEVVLWIRDTPFFHFILFHSVTDSRYPLTFFLWRYIIIVGCKGFEIPMFYYNSKWLWKDVSFLLGLDWAEASASEAAFLFICPPGDSRYPTFQVRDSRYPILYTRGSRYPILSWGIRDTHSSIFSACYLGGWRGPRDDRFLFDAVVRVDWGEGERHHHARSVSGVLKKWAVERYYKAEILEPKLLEPKCMCEGCLRGFTTI